MEVKRKKVTMQHHVEKRESMLVMQRSWNVILWVVHMKALQVPRRGLQPVHSGPIQNPLPVKCMM